MHKFSNFTVIQDEEGGTEQHRLCPHLRTLIQWVWGVQGLNGGSLLGQP